MTPDAPPDEKARHLRRLYRQNGGERAYPVVRAEYARLYGEDRPRYELAHILTNVWIEARQLAGWSYDFTAQAWRRADGSIVVDDSGREWAGV